MWHIWCTSGHMLQEHKLWHAIMSPSSLSFPEAGRKQNAEGPGGQANPGPKPCSHWTKFIRRVAPVEETRQPFVQQKMETQAACMVRNDLRVMSKLGIQTKKIPMWCSGPWGYHHGATAMLWCWWWEQHGVTTCMRGSPQDIQSVRKTLAPSIHLSQDIHTGHQAKCITQGSGNRHMGTREDGENQK